MREESQMPARINMEIVHMLMTRTPDLADDNGRIPQQHQMSMTLLRIYLITLVKLVICRSSSANEAG